MSKSYVPIYNSRGELVADDINVLNNKIVIDDKYVGDIQNNKVVIDNIPVGVIVKSKTGIVILNDAAFSRFKKYQDEKKIERDHKNSILRKIKVALGIAAVSLGTLAAIAAGLKLKNKIKEAEKERIETLQESDSTIYNYFSRLTATGKLSPELISVVSKPISEMAADEMDYGIKNKGKIVFADYMGIDVNNIGKISIDPHKEKADGQWTATIYYLDEYGNNKMLGHMSDFDDYGKGIIQFIIDASNIVPEKVTDKTRESYTNRLADLISTLEEKQYEEGFKEKAGFGM